MKLKEKIAQYDLEDAYWANWGGEWRWARRRVIDIAEHLYKEELSGKGK